MEDKDLRATAFFDDMAHDSRIGLLTDLALFAGNGHDRKFHLSVGAGAHFFHSNYVSGRHPVLLSTGADNRVHKSASIQIS